MAAALAKLGGSPVSISGLITAIVLSVEIDAVIELFTVFHGNHLEPFNHEVQFSVVIQNIFMVVSLMILSRNCTGIPA